MENAISQEKMRHWGWQADDNGRIISDTGQTVFDAGFVTAIRKVLATTRPKPQLASHNELKSETGGLATELVLP